ncbi:MAG TPA: hypothetical protein VLK65_25505 [Vicinamibacteria bacterium]|nr:hypothetical protein [Vicinamibacteria bacterium]
MRRPNEREFLEQALRDAKDLPEGLLERLGGIIEDKEDRSRKLRELFEELARD